MSKGRIDNLERPIAEVTPDQAEAAPGGSYSLPEAGDEVLVAFQPAETAAVRAGQPLGRQ